MRSDAAASTLNPEQRLLPGEEQLSTTALLRLWWKQPHVFSPYEKFFFILASLTMLAAIILVHEPVVLYTQGRPRLESTGTALQNDCATMGVGLFSSILEACVSLKNNTFATFNLNDKKVRTPAYIGLIDNRGGRAPGSTFETVDSWFHACGWTDYFTCEFINPMLTLTGHAFHGSLRRAQALTRDGFPVLQMPAWAPSQLIDNATVGLVLNLFLIAFCEKIQNGGTSLVWNSAEGRYEHTDGMQLFGDSFERYAISFGTIYGFFTGLACLTMSALLYKKACTKWEMFKTQSNTASTSDVHPASVTLQ